METMYYIGLDVHKRKMSYCVTDGSATNRGEGTTLLGVCHEPDRRSVKQIRSRGLH